MKKSRTTEDQDYTEFSLDNEPSMEYISEMNLNDLRKILKESAIQIKGTKQELSKALFDHLSEKWKEKQAEKPSVPTVKVLREQLKSFGLSTKGTKDELLERVADYEADKVDGPRPIKRITTPQNEPPKIKRRIGRPRKIRPPEDIEGQLNGVEVKKRERPVDSYDPPPETLYIVPEHVLMNPNKENGSKTVENLLKKKRGRKPKPTNPTNFEDVFLEMFGKVSVKDRATITTIDFNLRRLVDLKGIEVFVGLKKLVLSNNSLTDISLLKSCVNLEEVWLAGNSITDLTPLKDLPLQYLSVASNPISDLTPIVSIKTLKYLNIGFCQIKDLSGVEDLIDLIELNINSNQIEDLDPLKGLLSLKSLSIKDNKLKSLVALKDLTIRELYIKGNGFEEIEVLSGMLHFPNFVYK